MRRIHHHRTSGRETGLDAWFGARGAEGDPQSGTPDATFPLRPFAVEAAADVPVEPPAGGPPDPDRVLQRAMDAAELGRLAEAGALFREVLELAPAHRDGTAAYALLLERQGDPVAAVDLLDRGLRERPDDAILLLVRAGVQRRRKELAAAEADVRRVLKGEPQRPEAVRELGLVLLRRGLAPEGAEALRRHAALRPDDPDAWFDLGEALNQAGDLKGALDALRRGTALDEHDPRPYNLMGRVLDRLGKPDEAMPMYRRARELTHS
jgi:predicted Zn-dependent protease